ncbi:copper resistance protein CopC [Pseudonocardia sp.]|uniref:copper resistance CopC family protein n=1 Tax=Pseudonocardia sp. TaxID=60912 RepID=UPI003D142588
MTPSTTARRLVGMLLLAATCWMALLVAFPTPSGDPVLISTTPAEGEIVKSPDTVQLTFDRPVPAGLGTVRMTRPSGEQIVTGRPTHAPGTDDTLVVTMPQTRYGGTYALAWSLPSTRLEPIEGTLRFHVFAPKRPAALPEIAAERDRVVAVAHGATRLVATAALTVGVGIVVVLVAVWPAGVERAPVRRLIKATWWALVLATVGTILTFGGYAARTPLAESFDPALVVATFGAGVGAGLSARLLVLVPVTVGLILMLTGNPAGTAVQRWTTAGSVLAGASALAATWSYSRPQDPDGPALLAVTSEAGLLLAVAVCVGGPVLLWTALRCAADSELGVVVPRLARLMPVCAAVLLAVAAATARGWQLAALVALAALVVAVALAGHGWARRRADTRGPARPGRTRLRRAVAVAAVAGAVALTAAAATAPAPGHAQLALATRSAR